MNTDIEKFDFYQRRVEEFFKKVKETRERLNAFDDFQDDGEFKKKALKSRLRKQKKDLRHWVDKLGKSVKDL